MFLGVIPFGLMSMEPYSIAKWHVMIRYMGYMHNYHGNCVVAPHLCFYSNCMQHCRLSRLQQRNRELSATRENVTGAAVVTIQLVSGCRKYRTQLQRNKALFLGSREAGITSLRKYCVLLYLHCYVVGVMTRPSLAGRWLTSQQRATRARVSTANLLDTPHPHRISAVANKPSSNRIVPPQIWNVGRNFVRAAVRGQDSLCHRSSLRSLRKRARIRSEGPHQGGRRRAGLSMQ